MGQKQLALSQRPLPQRPLPQRPLTQRPLPQRPAHVVFGARPNSAAASVRRRRGR
jgi:hypothetical protein